VALDNPPPFVIGELEEPQAHVWADFPRQRLLLLEVLL
jgi:hypothetical protein